MKKLLSLALVAMIAVVAGCQKSDSEKAADSAKDAANSAAKAATNAVPK